MCLTDSDTYRNTPGYVVRRVLLDINRVGIPGTLMVPKKISPRVALKAEQKVMDVDSTC
jgi:hypothetical protein